MYTQCPQCDTVFRISAADLGVAHGDVRCGQCNTTFNALVSLSEEPPPGAPQPHFPTAGHGAESAVPAELIDAAVEAGMHAREHEEDAAFIPPGDDEAEPQPDPWATLADDAQGVVLSTTPAGHFTTAEEDGQHQGKRSLDDAGEVERPFGQPRNETGHDTSESSADEQGPGDATRRIEENEAREETDDAAGDGTSDHTATDVDADDEDRGDDDGEASAKDDDTGKSASGDDQVDGDETGADPDDEDHGDYDSESQPDNGTGESASGDDQADGDETSADPDDEDHGDDHSESVAVDKLSEKYPAAGPGGEPAGDTAAELAENTPEPDSNGDDLPSSAASAARLSASEADTDAENDETGKAEDEDLRREDQDLRADMADLQRYLEPPRRLWLSILWGALSLLATVALMAQFAHHWRHDLVHHDMVGPLLQKAYDRLGISLQPDWDVAAYRLVARPDVASLEGEAGQLPRLRITAALENQGGRAQPLPLVRVTLEDRWGNAIATRNFLATEYSHQPSNDAMLAPGERMRIDLRVVDPGGASVGYTIDLCLPTPDNGIRCAGEGGS